MGTSSNLECRIKNGIAYFWDIKPSQWQYKHHAELVTLLKLLKDYFYGHQEELKTETLEEVINKPIW